MFIAFTVTKSGSDLSVPITHEWLNKMWNIHTTEFYPTFKRKRILIHETLSKL